MAWVLLVMVGFAFAGISGLVALKYGHTLWWGLFACATLGLALVAQGRIRVLRPVLWLALWLSLYFVGGYVLSDRSDDPEGTAQVGVSVLLPLLLMVPLMLRDRRQWERLALALQLTAIGACAVSVAQTISPAVLDYTTLSTPAYAAADSSLFSRTRVPALWMNPNQAALCFFFSYALSLWCPVRWLAWAGRVAAIVGMFLTVSRGGWLMMAGFTLAYLLAQPVLWVRFGAAKRSSLPKRCGSIVAIATAICSIAVLMPQQRDELLASVSERAFAGDRLTEEDLQRNVDDRYFLATYWLEKAMHGPWYGQGLRSFQVADGFADEGPHNQFVMVYGEVGIVGLLTYLWVLGLGLRRTWALPMDRRDRSILLLIWGGFLFWHFKGHGLFNQWECMVIWGVLFTAPYALMTVPSRVRVSRVSIARTEVRLGVR
jgi:O-Antigen ligase